MKRVLTAIAFILTISISVNAMGEVAGILDSTNRLQIDTGKWNLSYIASDTGISLNGAKAFIQFDSEKNRISGKGGCNNFGGAFTNAGNEIAFSNIFSTKMFCAKSQNLEAAFFSYLSQVNRFKVEDKNLFLYKGDQLLLEFRHETLSPARE